MEQLEKEMNLTVSLMVSSYANEMVMIAIDDIEPVLCNPKYFKSDYGTKQYKKLKSMANKYSSAFNELISKEDDGWCWASFNQYYDTYIEKKTNDFREAVRSVYYHNDIRKANLIADITVLDAIAKLSLNVIDYFMYKFKYSIPEINQLAQFRLTKISDFIRKITTDITSINKSQFNENFDIMESRKVKDTFLAVEKGVLDINTFLNAFEIFKKEHNRFFDENGNKREVPLTNDIS